MTFFTDCYPKPFLSGSLTATSTLFSADEIIFPIPCDRVFTIGRDPALAANPDDSGYIDNRYNFVNGVPVLPGQSFAIPDKGTLRLGTEPNHLVFTFKEFRPNSVCNTHYNISPGYRLPYEQIQHFYEFGELLGQGAFGKVLKVKHRGTGELYALKVIQPEPRREIDETDPIRRDESAFKYRDLRLVTKTSGLGGGGC
ncbi:hypothetical protein PHLCEN_2v2633 [Hermanssonia centrifuga]|uniref:Protein kinase domain-containing protein n=1 Tax=Hermanssonia centrifuga TaxID=98765 RepID=A0A2R6RIK7_9APHY|nr:hypothetical protein PHLCEN_2v2633 [Hermanssonia centrifuga]